MVHKARQMDGNPKLASSAPPLVSPGCLMGNQKLQAPNKKRNAKLNTAHLSFLQRILLIQIACGVQWFKLLLIWLQLATIVSTTTALFLHNGQGWQGMSWAIHLCIIELQLSVRI
jgi:hypothetical protein